MTSQPGGTGPLLSFFDWTQTGRAASTSRSRRIQKRHNHVKFVTSVANSAVYSLNELSSSFSTTSQLDSFFPLSSAAESRAKATVWSASDDYVRRLEASPTTKRGDKHADFQNRVLSRSELPNLSYLPSATTALPIIADRLSLPDRAGAVEMLAQLPPDLAELYSSPAGILRPEPPGGWRDGPAAFLVSHVEYVKTVKRLMAAGMVEFTTSPIVVNGLFAVAKPDGSLRLIMDTRRFNARCIDPADPGLPNPGWLAELQVEDDADIYEAKTDVSDYYHSFSVPAWMRPYLALPPLKASELGLGDRYGPDTLIYPMCTTLPMGWSHSVTIGQRSHEHLVDTAPAAEPRERITATSDRRLDRVRMVIYIDDVLWFGKDKRAVADRQARYLERMRDRGFLIKEPKVHPPCLRLEGLGLEFDGVLHRVGVSPIKLRYLCEDTTALIAAGRTSGVDLANILGRWTWAMLVRRPALSAFSSVYRFAQIAGRRVLPLWPSVVHELHVAIGLAPLLFARLDKRFAEEVVASDASSSGLGVVGCRVHPQDVAACASAADDVVRAAVQSLSWFCIVSAPWRGHNEHISSLELRAASVALRNLVSRPSCCGKRVLLLTDSTNVAGALTKGRSSSPMLLRRLRAIAAFSLAWDLQVFCRWIPSGANPADEPSRRFEAWRLTGLSGPAQSRPFQEAEPRPQPAEPPPHWLGLREPPLRLF
jgi:hypothetical protein